MKGSHTFRLAFAHVSVMNNSQHPKSGASSLDSEQGPARLNDQTRPGDPEKPRVLKPLAAVIAGFIFCALQTTAQAQDYTYTINAGAVTIVEYTGPGGDVVIPGSIAGLPVVRIGFAFFGRTDLTSVIIPDTVTALGYGAFFGCSNLISIVIGNSVSTIDESALEGCVSLTNIHIPASVTYIEPGYRQGIAMLAPAFNECISLTAITVDPGNSFYSSVDGVLFNKDQTLLIRYPAAKPGNYTISDGVQDIGFAFEKSIGLTGITIGNSMAHIGRAAFAGCRALTNVVIPTNVTSIGSDAFADCTSLSTISIPSSITSIDAGWGTLDVWEPSAFFGSNLEAIHVDPLNPIYSSVDGVLFNKSQTSLIQYPGGRTGSYIVPGSVERIELNAFAGCTGLAGVTLGKNLANIGAFAFFRCTGLTSVTIPESVTNIGVYAFADCTEIVSVVLGGNITRIQARTFLHCTELEAVYLPGSPPVVAHQAFSSPFIAYYLPGMAGWGTHWAGQPTALWLPRIEAAAAPVAGTNAFSFTVTWASRQAVMIETCTNLTSPTWTPRQLTVLTNDSVRFDDPGWTNGPARFYRVLGVELPVAVIPVTNMVFIPPGTFTTGSPVTESARWDDEGSQTPVTISRGF